MSTLLDTTTSTTVATPILKIPLLLVFLACAHVSFTPPASAAPPVPAEKAPSTSLEFLLSRGVAAGLKVGVSVLVAIEIVIICATHIPELAPLQPLVYRLFSFPHALTPSSSPLHLLSSLFAFLWSSPSHPGSLPPLHPPATSIPVQASSLDIHPTLPFILSLFLTILGASVRFLAYKDLGHMFTFEMSIRRDHTLVTRGVYGWVRHPSYTGAVCFAVGAVGCVGCPGSWLRESGVLYTPLGQAVAAPFLTVYACILVGLLRRIRKEDDALKLRFGEEWERWAGRVRWMSSELA